MKEKATSENYGQIINPSTRFFNAKLDGPEVISSTKLIGDLKGIFEDEQAFQKMEQDRVAYKVDAFLPVEEGTEGGLFFGLTHLYPGKVGNEFFMTRGHFHTIENRAEFYWGIEGEGLLLLMNKAGKTRAERMVPGSLNYIPGHTAHRVVNTGEQILQFGACWPSDAGHDYETIAARGFSARVKEVNNSVELV